MPDLNDIFADRFLAVGHRGFPAAAPENTIVSFERAAATGVGLVELDVQLSRDGVPMVIHDAEVDRTTNGSGLVRGLTSAEIARLDAGSWYGAEFRGERVPTLAEALAWADERAALVVELKNDVYTPAEMDQAVDAALAAIDEAGMAGRTAVISFDHRAVRRVEASGTGIVTGCLIMPRPFRLRERASSLIRTARDAGNGLVLPFHRSIGRRLTARLKSAGLKILTWTADTEADIIKQLDLGVSGMASNNPGLLAATLKEAGVRF